jgi:hypothetical protein
MSHAALLYAHLGHTAVGCTLFLYSMTYHDVTFPFPKSLTHRFHMLPVHQSCLCYEWLGLGQYSTTTLFLSLTSDTSAC